MRCLLVSFLFAVTPFQVTQAQQGNIGLYSDTPGYSDRCLNESLFAVNSVWVVHNTAVTGRAAKFQVVHNWAAAVQPTDYHGNTVVGDIYTGVEIFYADTGPYTNCQLLPYLLAELRFIPTTPTPECEAVFHVVPHPDAASGYVETVDCDGTIYLGTGGFLIVNSNVANCPCLWDPFPVGAETSTWGAVKALYQ